MFHTLRGLSKLLEGGKVDYLLNNYVGVILSKFLALNPCIQVDPAFLIPVQSTTIFCVRNKGIKPHRDCVTVRQRHPKGSTKRPKADSAVSTHSQSQPPKTAEATCRNHWHPPPVKSSALHFTRSTRGQGGKVKLGDCKRVCCAGFYFIF